MLMQYTTGVNFINILLSVSQMKVFCAAFFYLQFDYVIFWLNNIGAKAACKMLLELSTGQSTADRSQLSPQIKFIRKVSKLFQQTSDVIIWRYKSNLEKLTQFHLLYCFSYIF